MRTPICKPPPASQISQSLSRRCIWTNTSSGVLLKQKRRPNGQGLKHKLLGSTPGGCGYFWSGDHIWRTRVLVHPPSSPIVTCVLKCTYTFRYMRPDTRSCHPFLHPWAPLSPRILWAPASPAFFLSSGCTPPASEKTGMWGMAGDCPGKMVSTEGKPRDKSFLSACNTLPATLCLVSASLPFRP